MEINAEHVPDNNNNINNTNIKLKKPKRILHFSDGILEEFSSDEEDEVDKNVEKTRIETKTIDESKMTWGPWMLYKASQTGGKFLSGCDYVGETIASFLGITTPKYNYEIEAFKKMQQEKAENDKEEETSWTTVNNDNVEHQPVSKPMSGTTGPMDKF